MCAITRQPICPGNILRVKKNRQKGEKVCDFRFFFIIGQVFFKGVHRKGKKVNTVFASIPIPNYVFSKNKNNNSLKPQLQCLMKTIAFYKTKNVFQYKNALKRIP